MKKVAQVEQSFMERILGLGEKALPYVFPHRVSPAAREQFVSGFQDYLNRQRASMAQQRAAETGAFQILPKPETDEELIRYLLSYAKEQGYTQEGAGQTMRPQEGTGQAMRPLEQAIEKRAQARGVMDLLTRIRGQLKPAAQDLLGYAREVPGRMRRFYTARPEIDMPSVYANKLVRPGEGWGVPSYQAAAQQLRDRQLRRILGTGMGAGAAGAGYMLWPEEPSTWERVQGALGLG